MTIEDKRIKEINSASEHFIAGPLCEEDFTEENQEFIEYCFAAGAQWADENPKSPWISVKDDLPYNHPELLHNNYTTNYVLALDNGYPNVKYMSKLSEGNWHWLYAANVTHWMPIPKLEIHDDKH